MDRVRQEALAPVQSPLIFSLVAHIGAKRPYQAEDNVELIPMKLKSEIKWELLVLVHRTNGASSLIKINTTNTFFLASGVFHTQLPMSRQELDKIKLLRREIDRLLQELRDAQNESYEPMRRVKIRWATIKLREARSKLQHEILRRSI